MDNGDNATTTPPKSKHSSSSSASSRSNSSSGGSTGKRKSSGKKPRAEKKIKMCLIDEIISSESNPIKVVNSSLTSAVRRKTPRIPSNYRARHHSDDDEEAVGEEATIKEDKDERVKMVPDKRTSIANLPRITKIRRIKPESIEGLVV